MAKSKPTPAAKAPTFGPQHVKLIEDRLGEIQGNIYLVANMATLIAPSTDENIELRTVLRHMSDILTKAAEALTPDQIIPFAERTKEIAHV